MYLDSALDELEFDNLAQLQDLTKEGDEIIDSKGQTWLKTERNWWRSYKGEEVLGSLFFNYGIKVYHSSAKVLLEFKDKPEKPHSRACGFAIHAHGPACSFNCPTCGGKDGGN